MAHPNPAPSRIDSRPPASRPRPDALTPSSTTSSRAPEASSCRVTSASVRLGLTGVTVAPNRQHANSSTTNSTRLRNLSATTSPHQPRARQGGDVPLEHAPTTQHWSTTESRPTPRDRWGRDLPAGRVAKQKSWRAYSGAGIANMVSVAHTE